jgi:hydrogenase 3 maturation protease
MTPMSMNSWQSSLLQTLAPQGKVTRLALVGIGNEFNGDDAAGVLVARQLAECNHKFQAGQVLVIDAGQVPENIVGSLRRFEPGVVLLVDAAQMGQSPGTVALVPLESVTGMSASSHSLPLSMLAGYLQSEFDCEVHLLGIQPRQNESYSDPSPDVLTAVQQVSSLICRYVLAGATTNQ